MRLLSSRAAAVSAFVRTLDEPQECVLAPAAVPLVLGCDGRPEIRGSVRPLLARKRAAGGDGLADRGLRIGLLARLALGLDLHAVADPAFGDASGGMTAFRRRRGANLIELPQGIEFIADGVAICLFGPPALGEMPRDRERRHGVQDRPVLAVAILGRGAQLDDRNGRSLHRRHILSGFEFRAQLSRSCCKILVVPSLLQGDALGDMLARHRRNLLGVPALEVRALLFLGCFKLLPCLVLCRPCGFDLQLGGLRVGGLLFDLESLRGFLAFGPILGLANGLPSVGVLCLHLLKSPPAGGGVMRPAPALMLKLLCVMGFPQRGAVVLLLLIGGLAIGELAFAELALFQTLTPRRPVDIGRMPVRLLARRVDGCPR